MSKLELFFNEMAESQAFSERIIEWIYKSKSSDSENAVLGMTLGHLVSLNGYYRVKDKFPELATYIGFIERINNTKELIRNFEDTSVIQMILDKLNEFSQNTIDLT
jgi:hypothetical protein